MVIESLTCLFFAAAHGANQPTVRQPVHGSIEQFATVEVGSGDAGPMWLSLRARQGDSEYRSDALG